MNVLIIDEVSMLDDKLFFEIKRYNNDVKIIMLGDPLQIPPIGKEDCEPFLNPEEHGIIDYQLTEIMRQSNGSCIVENSLIVRENIKLENIAIKAGSDVFIKNAINDREFISKWFESNFTLENIDSIKAIAWTNKKVEQYNNYIRGLIYPNRNSETNQIDRFIEGERLVMNKPFTTNEGDYEENQYLLTTNQEIKIVDFSVKSKTHEEFTFSAYRINIEYTRQNGKKAIGYIDVLHEDSELMFNKELNSIKEEAIYGDLKDRRDNWKKYYNLLRCVADVKYAYSLSIHKSQGSTFNKTVIDLRNINLNQNIVERNRIFYTALTRAKSEVLIIT